jgi:VWFA-related protein
MVLSSILLVITLIGPFALAQSGRIRSKPQTTETQGDKDTLRLRAEEVLLPVSVRSDNGRLPTRLDRADFIVTEDNKRQRITSVLRLPANLLIVLDTSGEVMTRKNINLNRELALRLIDSLSEDDRAAVVTYGDKIQLLSEWTNDKAALKHALQWKFRPGMKARFHEALLYAAEEILPQVTGRRSVALVTDGVDSFTDDIFEKALAAMHKVRATLYIASHTSMLINELRPRVFNRLAWYEMLDPGVRERYKYLRSYVHDLEAAEIVLKGLAEETGGAIWAPSKLDDFKSVSSSMIDEIGTEYVVAYSSERQPDDTAFHAVKVFTIRTDLKVRTRRGLYANLAR